MEPTFRVFVLICVISVIFKGYSAEMARANGTIEGDNLVSNNITKVIDLREFLAHYNASRSSFRVPQSLQELNAQEMRKIKALQVKIQRLQQTVDNGNSEIQQRVNVLTKNQESLAIALANLQKEFQMLFSTMAT